MRSPIGYPVFIRDRGANYGKPEYHGELTAEYLRWALRYDPETGHFTRLRHRYGRTTDGARAGAKMKQGYIRITVAGKAYLAHRLAYLYQTGEWPPEEIDHVNMVKDDNRWSNLRAATRSMNFGNRRVIRNGLKGVGQRPSGRWYAQVGGGKNRVVVGTFDTEEQAHEAYRKAAVEMYGEYARFE